MKATDEKWDTEYDGLPLVYTDNGLLVATMYDPEQANLAAAAPDLYRALVFALECWSMEVGEKTPEDTPKWVIDSCVALAKARGEA